ncbi:putative redox protein [Allopseudospirillum japonicum]|uniref:Putative redox protein n=1 Tax=Allopseudospirillum japonicum TaxID=64971 RepID=A0A1H6Q6M7_9GAMM|nr:OsmC family protein [Allopseudospirillum japonicum]SEI39428.1 putative redox protein [Allopseudospirillum japonicum]
MQAHIKWTQDVQFVAESGSGHALVMDGAAESGGRNTGPRPMEMLLMGLGGCTSYDVVTILRKARQKIINCEAKVEAQRAQGIPAIFTEIHIHFIVTGQALKESQVKRAIDLSAEKYCSASLMLAQGGVKITHSFEIQAVDL